MKLENQKLVKDNLREEIVLDDVGEMSGVGSALDTRNNATERNKTHLSSEEFLYAKTMEKKQPHNKDEEELMNNQIYLP